MDTDEIYWDEIEEIEYLDPEEYGDYVYDFSVEDVETFTTVDGLVVHNTLNTFHNAGTASKSNVNSGVPRLKELISATQNQKTPSLTVYLKDQYKTSRDHAKELLNKIEKIHFDYFIESSTIYYDLEKNNQMLGEEHQQFMEEYCDFFDMERKNMSPWVLCLKLNDLKMLDKNMSMFDLYTNIYSKCLSFNKKKEKTVHISYTDENSNELYIYIRFEHDNIDKQINGTFCTSGDLNELEKIEDVIVNDNILSGIKDISDVKMREINSHNTNKNNEIVNEKEIVLDTTGSNLRDIMKFVDYIKQDEIISNNIHEINEMFGIEAARQQLKDEINSVMLLSGGIYINDAHLNLLCDFMTLKGIFTSMDRHGLNKSNVGPLTKCSFEESHEHFVKSALFSQADHMKSVTSNLIMGQVGKYGTGFVDVIFDNEKFAQNAHKNKINELEEKITINLSE